MDEGQTGTNQAHGPDGNGRTVARWVAKHWTIIQLLSLVLPLVYLSWVAGNLTETAQPQVPDDPDAPADERYGVSPEQRQMIATELQTVDPIFVEEAGEMFPDQPWSQRDHWQRKMSLHIRYLVDREGVSREQIYLVYDELVRGGCKGHKCLPTHLVPLEPRRK